MRYIVSTDGTYYDRVVQLATYPIRAVRVHDGTVVNIQGQRRGNGQTFLYGELQEADPRPWQIVIGPEDYVTEDLHQDSLANWRLIFPDVNRDVIGKWVPEARKTVLSVREVDSFEKDRTFRQAWRDEGTVRVNMPAAREIHRARIRAKRAKLFPELDAQVMRANEMGTDPSEAIAKKQRLRDLPADPAIDAAQTPEELKAAWPAILEEK